MIIRRAVVNDSTGVARVQVESWKTTYKKIVPDEYLNSMSVESRIQKWKDIIESQTVFVVEKDSKIIGFCNSGINTGDYRDYQGELFAIYLLQDYQRKGLGRHLFDKIVTEFKEQNVNSLIVKVLEDNPARYFYEKVRAEHIDTIELIISGKKLNERVYGWKSINTL